MKDPIRIETASRHDPDKLEPQCMHCRFWDNENSPMIGTCRRNPPGGGFWRPDDHQMNWIGANWPDTLNDDWCGSFEERTA